MLLRTSPPLPSETRSAGRALVVSIDCAQASDAANRRAVSSQCFCGSFEFSGKDLDRHLSCRLAFESARWRSSLSWPKRAQPSFWPALRRSSVATSWPVDRQAIVWPCSGTLLLAASRVDHAALEPSANVRIELRVAQANDEAVA